MMRFRILWTTAGGICLILVLLGLTWSLGGYNGMSLVGGVAVTLGIIVTIALGIGLMALIFYGRRSRRDAAVHRAARHD